MKKAIALLSSILILGGVTALAQDNSKRIEEIKTEIKQKEDEIKLLKDELKHLSGTEKKENEFELDEPLDFGDFVLTVKDFWVTKDFNGNSVVVIEAEYENTSDKEVAPAFSVSIKGYQNGVETGSVLMAENVDVSQGMKNIKPGGKINYQDTVLIEDPTAPIDIDIDKLFNFGDNNTKTITLHLDELKVGKPE